MTAWRVSLLVICSVLVTAAAPPVPPAPRLDGVVIAVAPDGTISISLNGRRISCAQLNAYILKRDTARLPRLADCKLMKTQLDQ